MRASSVKTDYRDKLALRRHHTFLLKIIGSIIISLVIITGIIYFLFFSSVLRITLITINADPSINQEEINSMINTFLDTKSWLIKIRRNILFLNSNNLEAVLKNQLPLIKDAVITKKYPHALVVTLKEHTPIGIWCYKGLECQYFDKDMVVWGNPGKSSGFILLSVDDQRPSKDKIIDENFFKPVLNTVKGLPSSIVAKGVIIPEISLSDFTVLTDKNYYLSFSYESNLSGQLKALKLFLDEKEKDPSFNPQQYIDLRINNRIYYK